MDIIVNIAAVLVIAWAIGFFLFTAYVWMKYLNGGDER